MRGVEIVADFGEGPLLRSGKLKRQRFQQQPGQPVLCGENRCTATAALPIMQPQRQLLGQQFVELDTAPCGMCPILQRHGWRVRRRPMQEYDAVPEAREAVMRQYRVWQRFCKGPCPMIISRFLQQYLPDQSAYRF